MLINNMVDAGLINRESGKHYINPEKQWRQKINKYEIPENGMKEGNVVELFIEQASSSSYSQNINNLIDWGNWKEKRKTSKAKRVGKNSDADSGFDFASWCDEIGMVV